MLGFSNPSVHSIGTPLGCPMNNSIVDEMTVAVVPLSSSSAFRSLLVPSAH